MKQLRSLLIMMSLLMTPLLAGAQDTTAIPEESVLQKSKNLVAEAGIDTSKLTAKHVYDDVKGAISGLADALKVGAEHVYVVLIRQQIVDSILWLLVGILGFIFLAMVPKWSKKADWEDGNIYCGFAIGGGIFGAIMIICFIFSLDTIVTGFINPEYGAIEDIFSFIKTGEAP